MWRYGGLWFVGSLKLYVSFAEYRLFYRALLQKRPITLCVFTCTQMRHACLHIHMHHSHTTHVRAHVSHMHMYIYIYIYIYNSRMYSHASYDSHTYIYSSREYAFTHDARACTCFPCSPMCIKIHWKNPPPPGGVYYLLCSLIKNRE